MMKTAWAKAASPSKQPSLRDVMSEQLARELEREEKGEEEEERPFASASASAPEIAVMGDEDADLALALKLQQEFDLELHQRHVEESQRRHLQPYTKVVLESPLPPPPLEGYEEYDFDEDEDEDDDWEEEEGFDPEMFRSPNQNGRVTRNAFQGATQISETEWRTKHDAEITGHRNTLYLEETHPQQQLGSMEGIKLSNPVFNAMMKHAERSGRSQVRNKFGKSEQATREQVMDPATRKMLFSLVNSGTVGELHGAISSGKESVVYHASPGDEDPSELAVKIFKTTLTEFKARDKYVEGEHRFRHSLKNQNPRKLIRLWAEKEMRNLKRAEREGLRCPRALVLKKHILVMEFVGSDGKAAPKLAEARLKPKSLSSAYEQCVGMMRKLFINCRLVHADLSEFNMLWHAKQLWFIDLAQGVEWDHPNAMRFLRDDCLHVTQFFRGRGLEQALSVRSLFEFVTAEQPRALDEAMAAVVPGQSDAHDDNDAVWFNAFLPQRLSDIKDPVAASDYGRDTFHAELLVSSVVADPTNGDDGKDESGEWKQAAKKGRGKNKSKQ